MFEDECQRASLRRRGVIARGVAKRCLVAFLAFAMAFGTTPAQLWAEGAEGIAEAVAQAAPLAENGSGESATSPAADLNASGMVANGGTAEQDATATASGPTDKTEDDSAAGNEAPAASTSDASKQDTAVVSAAGEARLSLPRQRARRSLPRAPSSAPTPRAPSRPGPPRSGSR